MNIQNNQCLEFERKSMLAPFRPANDQRFSWLRKVYLKTFQDWLNSPQQRRRNFTKCAGQKMFISWQIYEGLKITVNSIIEASQFRRQRSLGSRNDNLSMADFGYNCNNNSIRNQKILKSVANGNVADSSMIASTDEPHVGKSLKKNESLNVNVE